MNTKIKLRITKLVSVLVLLIYLAACSNTTQDSNSISSNGTSSVQHIGTKGQLVSIQSENVRAAGYDEVSLIMTVQFDNGALYEYYGVPADLWTSFVAAQPHPWSQVGHPRLVKGGIPYKRIG